MMASGGGKEIKSLLKNAREAIRSKEFKEALKHCKGVLKLDKGNYNALVFIGVAAAELGQPDQAVVAYKKAIETDPEQLLAWQGLSGFFEKSGNPDYNNELGEAYKKMMDLLADKDVKKWADKTEKLVNLYCTMGNTAEAVEYLGTLITKSDENKALDYQKQVIDIISTEKVVSQGNIKQLQQAYTAILSASDLGQGEQLGYYTGYVKFLQKSGAAKSQVVQECQKMHKLFPSEVLPLTLLAQVHLQCPPDVLPDSAVTVYDKLYALQNDAGVALLGLGQRQLGNKSYLEARKLLVKGIASEKTNVYGWLYLARSQVHLHDNQAAEVSCKEGIKQLKSSIDITPDASDYLKRALSLCQADALLNSGVPSNVQMASQIYEKFMSGEEDGISIHCKLVQVYVILVDLDKAQQLCTEAEALSSGDLADIIAVQGLLHMENKQLQEAEQKLLQATTQAAGNTGLYHYWLGRLYWEMGDTTRSDKSKCVGSLLKAAKLDPYYSNTFLYLGHYYWIVNKDNGKGRKCYQKAYELNPRNEKAGAALGDAYLKLGEEEAAKELYLNVTGEAAAGTAKWAWLRLGLCYLKLGEASKAIASFQAALRADPKDGHCWECLGEAYMARGSLTAALKAFTRGTELDPSAHYCLFQIAAIKQSLGAFSEAVTEYQVILDASPDYIPALKGQGEAYVCLAKSSLQQFFTGRAVDYIQCALRVLSRAARLKPDLSCVWKLLGDACTLLHPLESTLVKITVPVSLIQPQEKTEEEKQQSKEEVLSLGARCYGRAVSLQSDCASLWHDLGMNYYHQAKCMVEDTMQLTKKALQCLKKAISVDSLNPNHWTALGVIAAQGGQPTLAQHAFIKSIQIEPQNVVAWTNLGTLYLSHGNMELAHKAFKTSQSLDPAYVQCWIGQALIAETIGSEETMDLFRHTTELTTHMESSIGYAHWVCQTLIDTKLDKKSDLYRFNIIQMNALPAAMVAIGKFADCAPSDPCAHTMLGLLLERQGLNRAAEKAYARALELLQNGGGKDEINLALSNHARTLCTCGDYEASVQKYKSISPLVEFRDITGLAIALYKMGDYPASYQAYEQAFQLASTDEDRSHVLSAMGMVAYKSGDTERTKTLLFKSCQLSSPSVHGLFALCALGLTTSGGDVTLATAAITELHKWQDKEEGEGVAADVAFLSAMIYAIQGNNQLACRQAAKLLKRYPQHGDMWALVAELMLQLSPNQAEEAVICSKTAMQNKVSGKNVPLINALAEVSIGQHSTTDKSHSCLHAAQKAVHLYPNDISNWAVLSASALSQHTWDCHHGYQSNKASAAARISKFVYNEGINMANMRLSNWSAVHHIASLVASGQLEKAKLFAEKIQNSLEADPDLSAFVQLVRIQISYLDKEIIDGNANIQIVRNAVLEKASTSQGWQFLAEVYTSKGLLAAAEACYRQALQRASSNQAVILLRLAYVALTAHKTSDEKERWLNLAQEAITEALKVKSRNPSALLLQGLLHQQNGNTKHAKRSFQQSLEASSQPCDIYMRSVARLQLIKILATKNDEDAIKILLEKAVQDQDPNLQKLKDLLPPLE